MNDQQDAKVLHNAFQMRLKYGDQAEALCSQAMDYSLDKPERWSVAYQLKQALQLIGTNPATY